MIPAYIVLFVMVTSLLVVAYRRKDGSVKKGVKGGMKTLWSLIPILVAAFLLAGLLPQAISPEVIQSWLGDESGIRGILIGSLAGMLIPGGPYVAFPLINSVYTAGASLSTAIAFVTGWAVLSIGRIPFEISFMGPKFTLIRLSIVIFMPPLAGLIAYLIFV